LTCENIERLNSKISEKIEESGRSLPQRLRCFHLMISPTGSGERLAFHITPFAIDFFTHGKRDDIQSGCLVIFPLVSLMNDQVSSLHEKGIKGVVVGPDSSETETKEASSV